jgi:hypothetical protein
MAAMDREETLLSHNSNGIVSNHVESNSWISFSSHIFSTTSAIIFQISLPYIAVHV